MAKQSELYEFARGFGLLSDPTRLGILGMLVTGPRNVTALCKGLGLPQPNVSYHLGLLRRGGLVIGTRKGHSVVNMTDAACMKELAAGLVKMTPKR
jgi:DNA-binding transcriptional ArsR family regulator